MSQASRFDCPHCGGPITVQGAQLSVTCPYCGKTAIVPEALRPKRPEPTSTPITNSTPFQIGNVSTVARPRSAGCTLLPLAIVFGLVLIGAALLNAGGENGFLSVRTPTPPAMTRTLDGTLPRGVSYASLQITVTKAVISNLSPGAVAENRHYRSDQAYGYIDIVVVNPLTSKSILIDSGLVQLQTGNGTLYRDASGMVDNLNLG
jgi:hypothetical protein